MPMEPSSDVYGCHISSDMGPTDGERRGMGGMWIRKGSYDEIFLKREGEMVKQDGGDTHHVT